MPMLFVAIYSVIDLRCELTSETSIPKVSRPLAHWELKLGGVKFEKEK